MARAENSYQFVRSGDLRGGKSERTHQQHTKIYKFPKPTKHPKKPMPYPLTTDCGYLSTALKLHDNAIQSDPRCGSNIDLGLMQSGSAYPHSLGLNRMAVGTPAVGLSGDQFGARRRGGYWLPFGPSFSPGCILPPDAAQKLLYLTIHHW